MIRFCPALPKPVSCLRIAWRVTTLPAILHPPTT